MERRSKLDTLLWSFYRRSDPVPDPYAVQSRDQEKQAFTLWDASTTPITSVMADLEGRYNHALDIKGDADTFEVSVDLGQGFVAATTANGFPVSLTGITGRKLFFFSAAVLAMKVTRTAGGTTTSKVILLSQR